MKTTRGTLIWATIITIGFSGVSEYYAHTFSTVRDYILTNPDAETKGVIIISEVLLGARYGGSSYNIRYSYSVNDVRYVGSQIDYGSKISDATKMKNRYPKNMEVTIYYDSSKPQYSTLEKTSLKLGIYGQLFVLVFSFLFFLWIIPMTKRPERPF